MYTTYDTSNDGYGCARVSDKMRKSRTENLVPPAEREITSGVLTVAYRNDDQRRFPKNDAKLQ